MGPDRRLKFQGRGGLVLASVQAVLRIYAKHGGCVSAQDGCRQRCSCRVRESDLFEKENCRKDGTVSRKIG